MRKTKGGGRQDWRTPKRLFDCLERNFGAFDLDVAADDENHLCDRYFTKDHSALVFEWRAQRAFCNPPFSQMSSFLIRARDRADTEGCTTFVIGPLDSGVRWFRGEVWGKVNGILLLAPRVNFVPPPGVKASSASGSSAIYVFTPEAPPQNPEVRLLVWR